MIDDRLALSNDPLKTNGMPSRPVSVFIASATVIARSRLSSTFTPPISTIGRLLEKEACPT